MTSVPIVAGGLVAELAGRDGPFPFPRTSCAVAEIASALGLSESCLRRWVAVDDADAGRNAED